jgi:hypothetical protein
MSFSIAFLDEPLSYPYEDPAAPAARGVLVLGDAREYFLASLYEWSKEYYESQWRHALKTILLGRDKAALITTYGSPENATHLEWWPMYAAEDAVFLQDHLLFYDRLTKPFSVQDAFSFLRDRQTTNEEGKAISEWMVSFSDVKEFARAFSV